MANIPMSPANHRLWSTARETGPALLVLADMMAWHEAKSLADEAGWRLLDVIPLPEASDHLQADCDAILLVCRTSSPMLEVLVPQLEALPVRGGISILIVASLETIDFVYSIVNQAATQLLCDPGEGELSDSLTAMRRKSARQKILSNWTADRSDLQWLSAQVRHLSDRIDALSRQVRS